jgi:hypothetical protein
MQNTEKTNILYKNLCEHPAVTYWQKLRFNCRKPEKITILEETRKSSVYQLYGVGKEGSDVVAKRCRRNAALVENSVYIDILPYLPTPSLRYYGFVEEPDDKYYWLFIEKAIGDRYLPNLLEHRIAVSNWLGLFHIYSAQLPVSHRLPEHGTNYYLKKLDEICERIKQNFPKTVLNNKDKKILKKIVLHCEYLKSCWNEIESLCLQMPRTVSHGDFVAKNMRLHHNQQGITVYVFDWETTGWGSPAIDLAQIPQAFTRFSAKVHIDTYTAIIRRHWINLKLDTLSRIVHLGTLFRLLMCIEWMTLYLKYSYLERPMRKLEYYESKLDNIVKSARWKD